jgi:hypothetical protein
MSSDRGRSWRPEKRVTAKQSRRKQVIGFSALLVLLTGLSMFLMIPPTIPVVQFAVVAERFLASDDTSITQFPPGSTAANVVGLSEVAKQLHAQKPRQVDPELIDRSVGEFVSNEYNGNGKQLIIYLTAAAIATPQNTDGGEVSLQLLTVDEKKKEKLVPFSDVLEKLRRSGAKPVLLLLELSERNPALASGVLADDVSAQIKVELRAAGIEGLTVICAYDKGERSWEFFEDASVAASDTAETAISDKANQHELKLPEFHGTVFGHFLISALQEGKATDTESLFKYLTNNVADWSGRHYLSTQNVWMETSGKKVTDGRLIDFKPKPPDEKHVNDPVASSESEKSQSKDSPAAGVSATSEPRLDAAKHEDSRFESLNALMATRDKLAVGTFPARSPARWLRLQTQIIAAERFALNANTTQLERICDSVQNQASELTNPKWLKSYPEILNWLRLPGDENAAAIDSASAEVQFRNLKQALGKETSPDTIEPKLAELLSRGPDRKAFVIELRNELANLERLPEQDRLKQIQQLLFLLNNITDKGWPLDEFPETMATVKEVLQSFQKETDPNALTLRQLVKLLEVRDAALQLAAGYGTDGRLLRQATWKNNRVADRMDTILKTLNSVERWLCVGAEDFTLPEKQEAVELAKLQLVDAESLLKELQRDVIKNEEQWLVQDAQKLELPFLIEYLALLHEGNSWTDEELRAALLLAESASAFPAGQLDLLERGIGFSRTHLNAMFQLTRKFSDEDPGSGTDITHLAVLKTFVNDRSSKAKAISATERLQILNIPHLHGRSQLFELLQSVPVSSDEKLTDKSRESGIWLSFWSLRLVDAISGQTQDSDWKQWKELVKAIIKEQESPETVKRRTALAAVLRMRWEVAMQGIKCENFVSETEVAAPLSMEIARRTRAYEDSGLISTALRTIGAKTSTQKPASLSLDLSEPVLSPSRVASGYCEYQIPLNVQGISGVYLLNEHFVWLNGEQISEDRIHVLEGIDRAQNAELRLRSASQISSPESVTLIGVNPEGAAVVSKTVTVVPSSENQWRLEVVQMATDKSLERNITLSSPGYTLPLPPATWEKPVGLQVRLVQVEGVARKVNVRIKTLAGADNSFDVQLSIPGKEIPVPVPLAPPTTPDASAVGTLQAATVSREFDISHGVVLEVTQIDPMDSSNSSSQLTLYPKLHEPESMFNIPEPKYDRINRKLELVLERKIYEIAGPIWPTQIPAEIVLSPALENYYLEQDSIRKTPNVNVDEFTFTLFFNSDIEQKLSDLPDSVHEFGVTVAGIPHAWWWQLRQSRNPEPINGLRAFVKVEDGGEVNAAKTFPELLTDGDFPALLVGGDWRKTKLRPMIFLPHDLASDELRARRGQRLSVSFRKGGSGNSRIDAGSSINVGSRYSESVTATAGKNGAWEISTTTAPFTIPPFNPLDFGLDNGRHRMVATLESIDSPNDNPDESAVSFVLDDSPPLLENTSIKLDASPTPVTDKMKGRIIVEDSESFVTGIRYGLNSDSMKELTFSPAARIEEDFELEPSEGYPKLEQGEKTTEGTGKLTVVAVNGAGLPTPPTIVDIKFIRPGKPVPMKVEPKPPGSIKVTFSIKADFIVTVTGPNGYPVEKEGPSPLMFDNVPAGSYSVKWMPKLGTAPAGVRSVVVESGKTSTISGD